MVPLWAAESQSIVSHIVSHTHYLQPSLCAAGRAATWLPWVWANIIQTYHICITTIPSAVHHNNSTCIFIETL